MLAGRFPGVVLAGTLSEQPTELDRKRALQEVLDEVESHRGEPWADQLLGGPFGVVMPDAIAKIGAYLTASSELATAVGRRSAAMEPAYTAFLAFKNAVRQAHGTRSDLYRRLRLRVTGTAPAAPTPEPPVVSTTPTVASSSTLESAAPSNGVAH